MLNFTIMQQGAYLKGPSSNKEMNTRLHAVVKKLILLYIPERSSHMLLESRFVCPVQKPLWLLVWGCFGLGPLVPMKENLNATTYTDILYNSVLPLSCVNMAKTAT